jgi:hypothetical protein
MSIGIVSNPHFPFYLYWTILAGYGLQNNARLQQNNSTLTAADIR